jgi:MFS transporter, DHA2 family, multidrug resistance protein
VTASILDAKPGSLRAELALLLATLMQAFDATIVNVALPKIEGSLAIDAAAGSWIVTTYLVAASATMPVAGTLRHRFGGQRLFIGAVGGFALASVLCALAPGLLALVAARCLQGACAGIILPLTQALLLDLHPKRDHPAVLARWGSTIVTGPIIGPLVGGALTELGSWSWIFYINGPICLLALIGVRGAVRQLPQTTNPSSAKIDVTGIALLTLTVTAFELLLQHGAKLGGSFGWEWMVEAAVIVAGAALLPRHFERTPNAVVDIQLFRDRNFAGAFLINLAVGAIFFATITLVPSVVEGPLRHDALTAGSLMAPRGMATMIAMLAMGYLTKVLDPRPFVVLGLIGTTIALGMFAMIGQDTSLGWIILSSVALGLGAGCLLTPLSVLTFLTIAPDARTNAAGLYNLARQLGGALGIAAVTAVIVATPDSSTAVLAVRTIGLASSPSGPFVGYFMAFGLLAVLALLALPLVGMFRVAKLGRPEPAASGGGAED